MLLGALKAPQVTMSPHATGAYATIGGWLEAT
jgi:hypothetical protein